MRIFLSAGEASGDAYGAALVREWRALGGDASFEGGGGSRMAGEGVRLIADTSHWGAISISQALLKVPISIRGYYRMKRALSQGAPGLFVPIDFGYANIRLARHAKNRGWRVLYFIPPACWRRDRQGKDLPHVTDAISTPFAWSAEILREMGANAHWFGHPIKQLLRDVAVERGETLAVLPGSRRHEIEENLPMVAQAVAGMKRPIEFALAPTVDVDAFRAEWTRLAPGRQDRFAVGETARVLASARAAVVCSGTATLEAALCRCPMVVVYRVPRAMEIEAKLIGFRRPRFIALPNILLDRDVVAELVQDEASPEAVRTQIDLLVQDSPERERQLADFEELDVLLGPADAVTQTARLARSMVDGAANHRS